ncbi:hypothetical protein NGUA41_01202 [Salmonella enterica]|nr:hypothetical protein NGUA40_02813 [Salmonella enterica]GAS76351.1 hypothetical protein NGUA41_01202 [Salmonella enterica]
MSNQLSNISKNSALLVMDFQTIILNMQIQIMKPICFCLKKFYLNMLLLPAHLK